MAAPASSSVPMSFERFLASRRRSIALPNPAQAKYADVLYAQLKTHLKTVGGWINGNMSAYKMTSAMKFFAVEFPGKFAPANGKHLYRGQTSVVFDGTPRSYTYDRKVARLFAAGLASKGYTIERIVCIKCPDAKAFSMALDLGKLLQAYAAHPYSGEEEVILFNTKPKGQARVIENPAKFDHCLKEVKAKGGAVSPYAVCTSALKKKRKNPSEAAAEAFEDFHGYPSTELVTVKKKVHHHKHLASAGELRALRVKGIDGNIHTISGFDGALLCFNEARNQLFVEGGDQSINLEDFGITEPHELETLGKLKGVDYFTTKTHLGEDGGTAVYDHGFRMTNENGQHVVVKIARYPDLIYRVLDEQLEFSGGSYTIRREGIDL